MRYDGSIQLSFGGGRHTFRLALGELQELEEVCGDRKPDGSIRRVGPGLVLDRLRTNQWTTGDILHTIRLGLIGGGMNQYEAQRMADRYVGERPAWFENALVALAVLDAALAEPDESLGEPVAGETGTGSQTAGSPSPASTETPVP